uniref:ATP-dependent DNA helicase RecG n=1 Tax=Ndongobacter massiliensis TaxID=1871025 RepID=UPI0009F8127B|nr:ATP-dependent DNA helicase RecG [Ndongobacter massiliensis]
MSIDLTTLPGIGPVRKERFAKIGIACAEDLIRQLPGRYEDRTHVVSVADLCDGQAAVFVARLERKGRLLYLPHKRSLLRCRFADETGYVDVLWHNQPYMARALQTGTSYCLFGRYDAEENRVTNPICKAGTKPVLSGIEPIYPLTRGLRNAERRRATQAAFQVVAVSEWEIFPPAFLEKEGLLPLEKTYAWAHFPETMDVCLRARQELSLRAQFLEALQIQKLQRRETLCSAPAMHIPMLSEYEKALTYSLTEAQRRCISEIAKDLLQTKPMNRLLQGDVGSGKTAVAFAAAYIALQNGYQVALMAPTEALAFQHGARAEALFDRWGIPVFTLSSSSNAASRHAVQRAADSGETGLFIGTHALFQETLSFSNLGLVITDEQHRFGVEQRKRLESKGGTPHVLVLSATPIPRTLMLALYGDLAVSRIDALPVGRQPIDTFVIDRRLEKRMAGFFEKQFALGHQGFIVCPRIEAGEDEDLWSVERVAQRYRKFLPHRTLEILHGKMSAEEKSVVLQHFSEGKIDLLVSTTVIEVGIDVPNATILAVGAAERFGLAQLHQLRGRVGRGAEKSYCILVQSSPSPGARARLRFLTQTQDGFAIARKDLALRGAGTRYGVEQHGIGIEVELDGKDETERIHRWLSEQAFCDPTQWSPALQQAVAEADEGFDRITMN